jgi:predicted ATPase
MITSIEALNYQCLRYVNRDLEPFHILIGPNASGKSTFLDVVGFLGDLLYEGPNGAVLNRANAVEELIWNHKGICFELAVELSIPERFRFAGVGGMFQKYVYSPT